MGAAWKALAAATNDSSAAHLVYAMIPVGHEQRDPVKLVLIGCAMSLPRGMHASIFRDGCD